MQAMANPQQQQSMDCDGFNLNFLPQKAHKAADPKVVAKKAKKTTKFKKAPDAPRRFKSAFIFFSTNKHREIRENMKKNGKAEKVSFRRL